MMLVLQAKYVQAEPFLQKALAIRRKVLGKDHPDIAQSYNNLGFSLAAQGKYTQAEPKYEKALAIYQQVWGQDHPQTAKGYNNLAASLAAQGKYTQAKPMCEKALIILRKVLGEDHPDTAKSYTNLAHNLHAEGKDTEAAEKASKAAHSFEAARLQVTFTGLERATFSSDHSPLLLLAVLLARHGKALPAWQRLEASLARGLLDEVAARNSRPLTAEERRQEEQLIGQIHVLEKQVVALLGTKKATQAHREQAAKLKDQRDELHSQLSAFNAALGRKYGPAAGKVYDLKAVQSRLPREAALLAWLDLRELPKAADRSGDHWACIVRRSGEPVWVKLAGNGPKGAWTEADDRLPREVRLRFAQPPKDVAAAWQKQATQLYRQRLAPLAKHLGAGNDLPPVQHLILLPSSRMAGIPVEALLAARRGKQPAYTVSYAPSGTMFAYLQEQREKAKTQYPARLLVLGDPIFATPDPPKKLPEPPDHGILLTQIQPKSNAARAGLRAGDVLLSYGGTKLTALADLAAALQKSSSKPRGTEADLPVAVWRNGRTLKVKVFPGPLGVGASRQGAAEAIRVGREAEELLRRSRGPVFQPLPGTRREVQAIAKLFTKADQLLGSDASEERLDRLAEGGKLKEYRFLHLATHGAANAKEPLLSYLALAQDKLPDPLKQVLDGKPAYTGQLTAAHIQTTWKLDADLVTLSACQTGLGKYEHGEGYLGFAQGLFLAGARSLVLSQWSVDDDATCLLMVRFYENLLGSRKGTKPLPKAKALQQAKDWLRQLDSKEVKSLVAALRRGKTVRPAKLPVAARPFAHPYYWAGFILVGDPN
jgi:CHAT domain-containing protein